MKFNEIKKVRKQGQLKVITIPKSSKIEAGDYVMVKKVDEDSERTRMEDKKTNG